MIRLGGALRHGCRLYTSASASTSSTESSSSPATDFNKTEENGIAHVTALNVDTNERSIVRLSLKDGQRPRKFRREFVLPDAAVAGLRNALLDCSRSPKQLQNEADQLTERLSQRRFPAPPEAVKAARDQIKRKLRRDEETAGRAFDDDHLVDDKIREAREYQLRSKVDKLLRKTKYNWKPLEFDDREDAAAYSLSRLVPNFAEVSRCVEELLTTDFSPRTVLDYGSGSGAGYWAIKERYGESIKDYCLIDTSDHMTRFSMDVMRGEDSKQVSRGVSFRRYLLPSQQTTYDLVLLHRTLGELGSLEARMQLIESLWQRTNRFMIIVESALEDSFGALLDARDHLLTSGVQLRLEDTAKLLEERGLMNDHMDEVLRDRSLSEFERFSIIKGAIPEDVVLPTVSPTATVFAPCPHDLGCPLSGKSSCSFPVRWRPIRADGRRSSREKDGTETARFSFVILEKGARRPQDNLARILKMRKMNGHVACDLCTAFKGIQRVTVSKRAGILYQKTRPRREGEQFPLSIDTQVTENMFDLYDQMKS